MISPPALRHPRLFCFKGFLSVAAALYHASMRYRRPPKAPRYALLITLPLRRLMMSHFIILRRPHYRD